MLFWTFASLTATTTTCRFVQQNLPSSLQNKDARRGRTFAFGPLILSNSCANRLTSGCLCDITFIKQLKYDNRLVMIICERDCRLVHDADVRLLYSLLQR